MCQAFYNFSQTSLINSIEHVVLTPKIWLGEVSASDTEAAFLGLHLSISDVVVYTKIYDGLDGFGFEVVSFQFLDGGVPRSASCGVCVSRLIRFAGRLAVLLTSAPA